ncbi:hypothetical protein GUITHDRAFT_44749, partial [Guillardia theta CCMP2712]
IIDQSALPSFAQVASLEAAKQLLKESIILPSKYPELFKAMRQPWKGILLFGPPGTGKTELAKAVAKESNANFMSLSPSNVLSKYIGESERLLKRIFQFAKNQSPTVLFFDEIDALGISRNGAESDHSLRRLMAELLLQFNTLTTADRVMVLAATNRIQDIDPALLRRFERKIQIGLMNQVDRLRLLHLKMGDTPIASDVDLQWVAQSTEGFSGAELELLCREASM